MGVPGQIPPAGRGPGRGSGHGPFGDKAFRGALVVCAVLVVLEPVPLLTGGENARSVGTAFVVLGSLGLVTGGGGLALEARMRRRAPEPPPSPPRDLPAATAGLRIRHSSRAEGNLLAALPEVPRTPLPKRQANG